MTLRCGRRGRGVRLPPDPTPGTAHRVDHSEYEGEVGETLLFRLFSVKRLRESTVGTVWHVADSRQEGVTWRAVGT
jgi:hypothetical protein